jgi:hypothetical protein
VPATSPLAEHGKELDNVITRTPVTINDGHWLLEENSDLPHLKFYIGPAGLIGMVAIQDRQRRWHFFDMGDCLASGHEYQYTLKRADDRWASRAADDIPF